MTYPTVAVTVDLAELGLADVAGAVVRARLDKAETYGPDRIFGQWKGTSDGSGQCVLSLFPNALTSADPAGLGTAGSLYTFRITMPDGSPGTHFRVKAAVPNEDCDLHDIMLADDEQVILPVTNAGLVRYDSAQALTAPQKTQARANLDLDTLLAAKQPNAVTDAAGYFVTKTVEAALAQLGAKQGRIKHITDYSGVDPSGATSSIVAINAAIAATAAAREILYFPDGQYLCDNSLYLVSHARLQFSPNAVLLRQAVLPNGGASFVLQADRTVEITDVSWIGGEIRGPSDNSLGGNVFSNRIRRGVFKDIFINYYGNAAIGGRAITSALYDSIIDNVMALNPYPEAGVGGIRIVGCDNLRISNCHCVSGDDCYQFVPAFAGVFANLDCTNSRYINCWGESLAGRLMICAITDQDNTTLTAGITCKIEDCDFIGVDGLSFLTSIQMQVSDTVNGIARIGYSNCHVTVSDNTAPITNKQNVGIQVTDGAYIKDIWFNQCAFNGSEDNIVDINCFLGDNAYGNAVRNITFESCFFNTPSNTGKSLIRAQVGRNLKFNRCRFKCNPETVSNLAFGTTGYTNVWPKNVVFTSCEFEEIGGDAVGSTHIQYGYGVNLVRADGVIFDSCKFNATTTYTASGSRAVVISSVSTNVLFNGCDLSGVLFATPVLNAASAANLKAYGNYGLADTFTDVVAAGAGAFYDGTALTSAVSLNVGKNRSADGVTLVSLYGDSANPTTYSVKMQAGAGTNATNMLLGNGTGSLQLGTNNAAKVTIDSTGNFFPQADNSYTSGKSANRWAQLYAATATINTSDEREKQNIAPITDDVLNAWATVNFVSYRWKEAAARKGDAARVHFGLIAQHVRDAFIAHGLDATEYGLLCHDEWDDEYEDEFAEVEVDGGLRRVATGNKVKVLEAGDRWGVRMDECLVLEMALMRRLVGL